MKLSPRFLAAFLLAVTASSGQAAPRAKQIVLTKADAGRLVAATVRRPLAIRLESNPSTGYAWRVIGRSNAKVAQPISVEEPHAGRVGMVGAPGTAVIRLTPQRRGVATVVLGYGRAWEKEPNQTLRFTFDVR